MKTAITMAIIGIITLYTFSGCGAGKYYPIVVSESQIPVVSTNSSGVVSTNVITATNAVANPDYLTAIQAAQSASTIAGTVFPNPFSPLINIVLGIISTGLVGVAGLATKKYTDKNVALQDIITAIENGAKDNPDAVNYVKEQIRELTKGTGSAALVDAIVQEISKKLTGDK